MRVLLLQSVCLVAIAAILSGCGKSSPSAKVAKKDGRVIGVSLTRVDEPWRAQIKADIEAAAAKYPDLKLDIRVCGDDAVRQDADLEALRERGVDAIIIRPVDPTSPVAELAKFMDAGVPVLVLDRAVVGDKYSCYIAADPSQIGAAAGKWLASQLDGKGKIVELQGPVDSLWMQDLHTAFRNALRDPGYRFVFSGRVDPRNTDAAKLMKDAMADVDKVDALFAYDDAAAVIAHETAKQAGRGKDVLFVGVGGVPSQGEADVDKGLLSATVVRPTGGTEAIDTAMKLLSGQKAPKKIVPQPRVIAKEAH